MASNLAGVAPAFRGTARVEVHEVITELADSGTATACWFQRGQIVDELAGTRLTEPGLSVAINAGFVRR